MSTRNVALAWRMEDSAMTGGAVWLVLVVYPSILGLAWLSTIESLFLTAPLMAVPMALALATRLDEPRQPSSSLAGISTALLPASVFAVLSFVTRYYFVGALLSAPWVLVTMAIGSAGLMRIVLAPVDHLDTFVAFAGMLYLPVGGIFLVLSRAGIRPMGFVEPIVILTAVHFHFTGFVAPVLASATGRALRERPTSALRIFRPVAAGVVGAPAVLALGWILSSPALKVGGAVGLALSHAGLAVLTLAASRSARPRGARLLLAISSLALLMAMCLAATYAIAEFRERPLLTIPFMAYVHGALLAFGFSICGLGGWLLERRAATSAGPPAFTTAHSKDAIS